MRLIHHKFPAGLKRDSYICLVFLPVNFLIAFGPHLLLLIVEVWRDLDYARLILLLFQIMAFIFLFVVLRKNKFMHNREIRKKNKEKGDTFILGKKKGGSSD